MNNEWNFEDPIDEIYAIRRKVSSMYGHNVDRMFEAMVERQRISESEGHRIVRLPIERETPVLAMA